MHHFDAEAGAVPHFEKKKSSIVFSYYRELAKFEFLYVVTNITM
jgi:hypothetical protein